MKSRSQAAFRLSPVTDSLLLLGLPPKVIWPPLPLPFGHPEPWRTHIASWAFAMNSSPSPVASWNSKSMSQLPDLFLNSMGGSWALPPFDFQSCVNTTSVPTRFANTRTVAVFPVAPEWRWRRVFSSASIMFFLLHFESLQRRLDADIRWPSAPT